jgi:hypothetical protein
MVLEGRAPGDPLILDNGRYVSVGEFLARARRVASRFDAGRKILNLCDRFFFQAEDGIRAGTS